MNEKGIYKHYKGNYYQVIDVVLHTETKEKMILYKALYEVNLSKEEFGEEPLFVRPYNMFFEKITLNGKQIPRFEFIKKN